jgi:hypothetical protein
VLPPLRGSLADRLHDAYAAVATRVGGGSGASDSALGGLAAAGGSRGAGMAALAKVLAICAGTVGGAAACVATGVVPAPLLDPPEHHSKPAATKVAHHSPHQAAEELAQSTTDYEPEPITEIEAEPPPEEHEAKAEDHRKKPRHEETEPTEEVAVSTPPPSESGATEYIEPPPVPEATSSAATSTAASGSSAGAASSSASSGTAAGEFGP